jgi:4-amino-4-deoxychorismate lyase
MKRSLLEVFGIDIDPDLEKSIIVPEFATKGIFKCRMVYDDKASETEFLPYNLRLVKSLRLVTDDSISYTHKFTDRSKINRLMELREGCDDIVIVKNGMITDSSYANVILRNHNGNWITPETFLLKGTRRTMLLKMGAISEASISYGDIQKYSEIRLINAMMDIDDSDGIPLINVY